MASVLVGGAGLARELTSAFDPLTGAGLAEPPVLASTGGLLQVRLEAAEGRHELAGRRATTLGYNGGLPGPTLRVRPGDRLRVRLVNRLDAPTNLHVHGLHVSPAGNGDNVFVTVEPGASFDYDYQLGEDHPPGLYWYHPHHHGMVADQVFGGLYGAIVVDEPAGDAGSEAAPVPVTRERVLVISDISLDSSGRIQPVSAMAQVLGREGDVVLVNGQVRPRVAARPDERERWRIVNACAARYLRLRLDGQQLQLLGMDSGRYAMPSSVDEIILTPGNRADVLVTTADGTSELVALPYDRGSMMMGMMGQDGGGGMSGMGSSTSEANDDAEGKVLVTMTVSGDPVPPLPAVVRRPEERDLRGADVTRSRELTFAMGMGGGGMRSTIDGRVFDPERIDQNVQVGSVEEWTLTNTSPMDHPVHLHVWPMQIETERVASAVNGLAGCRERPSAGTGQGPSRVR